MVQKKKNFKKRFKKKIPIYKKRFFWYLVLAILGVSGLTYLVLFSPVFKIDKIEITGIPNLEEKTQEIIKTETENKFLFFIKKDNLFLFNANLVARQLLGAFPELKSAELKKHFPDSLSLTLQQRMPVATWAFSTSSSENYFLVDETGVTFEEYKTGKATTTLPLIVSKDAIDEITLGKQIIDENKMKLILKIDTNLESLALPTNHFSIMENNLTAFLKEGWRIEFNLESDIDLTLAKLKLLLEKEITEEKRKTLEYIDLRFNKAYYK